MAAKLQLACDRDTADPVASHVANKLHRCWLLCLFDLHGQINTYSTCECRSPTDCTDTSQLRCHNYSCGTRAVEKLTRYRTRIGTITTEGPQSTSWRTFASIPLLAERASVSRRSSSTDAILRMATSTRCGWALFYTTFCGQTKRVLRVRVCSASTTVTSGHGIILMLSANVGIKSTSASAFGLVSSGTLSWAPICYWTVWLLNDIVIFWKLFYRGCLKMCLYLWGRSCGFSTTELQRTMGKTSGSGWTRHIQEGKVDWKWRADCMASSVAGSNSDGFFSCGDTWRSKFTQSLPGLSKISWQDFKQLWQRSMSSCLRRVWENSVRRTAVCLEMDGGRFEHLL
jgi:hypothetical protein